MPAILSTHAVGCPIIRHLALSTNAIEKISSLSGMDNLRILSLGRNLIKKIENLDAVAETLEELWISYNLITSLVSVIPSLTHDEPPAGTARLAGRRVADADRPILSPFARLALRNCPTCEYCSSQTTRSPPSTKWTGLLAWTSLRTCCSTATRCTLTHSTTTPSANTELRYGFIFWMQGLKVKELICVWFWEPKRDY